MGSGQSYLYIFLKNKKNKIEKNGYIVTPSKSVFPGCRDFEVVTFEITYNKNNGMDYDIYIYDTEYTVSKYSYVFAYCSPRQPTHVANEIKAYYSILAPYIPLVISFRRQNDVHNCPIQELRIAGWDYAAYISKYADGPATNVLPLLKKQFERLLWNRTLQLVLKGSKNINVMGYEQELGDNMNFRFIFLTKGDNAVMVSECLFSLDLDKHEPRCPGSKNPVDPYYLNSVANQYYDGIIVYMVRDREKPTDSREQKDYEGTVLLMQFIDVRNTTIVIKRKDLNGFWWAEESVDYNNDDSLLKALVIIKNDLKDVNTILLDKKDPYKGPTGVESHNLKAYNKYTHKFASSMKTAILYERTYPGIADLKQLDITSLNVEVYYLKVKTTKGEQEDGKPFLIIFDKDGTKENMIAYHFNNSTEFKNWVKFIFADKSRRELQGRELIEKLYQKVTLIDTYGGCTAELQYLRELAYKILLLPDEEKPPPRPSDPEEKRPKVADEIQPPPEDNSLLIIIGCSVGAFVLICLLAIGYGIYWYNTTIKLLT